MSEKSEIALNTDPPEGAEDENTQETPNEGGSVGGNTDERPFAGEFETAEELAEAYKALKAAQNEKHKEDKKPDSKEIPTGDESAKETVNKAGLDWDALNSEYAEHGSLSDDTYANLEKAGIPRDAVDTYIRGKTADAAAYDKAVYDLTGGQEGYSGLIEWARDALTDDEKSAFNAAVTSGNTAQATLAVEGLMARRAAKKGTPPSGLLNGSGHASGTKPFASQYEVTQAMRDPRYRNDDAYRKQVVERLRATNF